MLIEKFFPLLSITLLRSGGALLAGNTLQIDSTVTREEVEAVLKQLPHSKASGLDGVFNKILSLLAPDISADIAQVISNTFAAGTIPPYFKELTTLALCKESKKNYLLLNSYRLIALENSLIKVKEKILAN